MKKLVLGLALAGMTAMPAFAASSTWESWNRPAAHESTARSAYVAEPSYDAYAATPMARGNVAGPAVFGAPPVFAYGEYQGADPDPFIRQQLMRDPPTTNSMQ